MRRYAGMRSHHDPQRVMLSLRELREHDRVFVITSPPTGLSEMTWARIDSEAGSGNEGVQ
jgi:hypothetical protein